MEIEEEYVISLPFWVATTLVFAFLAVFYFWRYQKLLVGKQPDTASAKAAQALSKRQQAVMGELLKNKSHKEIAQALHIEVSTVKTHAHHIYRHYGVKGQQALIRHCQTGRFGATGRD